MTLFSFITTMTLFRDLENPRQPGKQMGMLQTYKDVMASSSFWRFLLLIVLLIGVRVVFKHLDAT